MVVNLVLCVSRVSSGVDVAEMLRTIHVSETIVSKMENSPTGHLAIAYLCYKIATPVRYMVTIGEFFFLHALTDMERFVELFVMSNLVKYSTKFNVHVFGCKHLPFSVFLFNIIFYIIL